MECGWEQKDNEEEEERKPEGVRCSNSVCKYAVMIATAPPPTAWILCYAGYMYIYN